MTGRSSIEKAVAHHQQGRLEEARRGYQRILARHQDHTDAVSLLGVLESQDGNIQEGLELLERAAKLSPQNAKYLENLGIALRNAGREEDAIARFGQALAIDPRVISVAKALGALLVKADRHREAEEVYGGILTHVPNDSEILANLAVLRREAGDLNAELELLWQAASQDVDDGVIWSQLAGALRRGGVPKGRGGELEPIYLACLKHPDVSPAPLGSGLASILKGLPELSAVFAALHDGDEQSGAQWFDRPEAWRALARPVLLEILPVAVLPDLEVEIVLRMTRARVARAVMNEEWSHPCFDHLDLIVALARQCFFNGYVWSYDADEQEAVETIAARFVGVPLEASEPHLASIALMASYLPLSEWERASEVLELTESGAELLHGVVRQQLLEPLRELELRDRIPTSQPVQDATSQEVRAMYEEHPYPRWSRLDTVKPQSVSGIMEKFFPSGDFSDFDSLERPTILVAGCGTGYHLLLTYRRFENARLMGVDLSLSSLGFAYRKMLEAGIEDVALLQADILELADWEESFDIIESSGVLHHMADPRKGWEILRDRLRPGGLMKIGLYSELARRPIVAARDFVDDGGFADDEDGIRAARQALIAAGGSVVEGLRIARDFFSLHEFRDLVFHVQEHRFDLGQIEEIVEELGLEFLGFIFEGQETTKRFKERFPDPGSEANLAYWRAFEEDAPQTFIGMYQFWLKRPAEG